LQHVIELYNNKALWEQISANGLNNVEKHFSMGAAKSAMAEMLRALKLPLTD